MKNKMILKRILTCFGLLLLGTGIGRTEGTKTARIVFDHYTYDFGEIRETDGDVSHTFRFTNEGDFPLVINSVGVSCGCTTPQFDKAPLLPGRTAEMKITFDPTNRPGRFEKVIHILCNDPRRTVRLTITGNVIPKPRTLQDDYPYYLGEGLRIADRNLTLGMLPHGKTVVRSVGIANAGKKTIRIETTGRSLPAYVTVRPKKSQLAPGERSEIELTFRAPEEVWGRQQGSFELSADHRPLLDPVEWTVIFTEDFGALSRTTLQIAPQAEYSSSFYHFSDQPQGKTLTREFQITNTGRKDLIIRHIGTTDNRLRVTADKTVILRDDTATLTVKWDTTDKQGRISAGITIVTNDPGRPAQEIRLQARMVK